MSVFSKFLKKDKQVSKTFEVDVSLYEKLEHLARKVYNTSINKLVNICIEYLIENQNVVIYSRPKNEVSVTRSYTMSAKTVEALSDLRDEYNISYNRLVNIAIRNVLIEEGIIKVKNK